MPSLFEDYEQQYAVLTAEVTSEIGKLKRTTSGGDKRDQTLKINGNLEEINELLEQMSLEIGDSDSSLKSSLLNRLNCYQAELKRLKQEFVNAKSEVQLSLYDSSDFDDMAGASEQQKQRLLDNSERIERTGRTLEQGYRTILETEQIGAEVLRDLSNQREGIQRSRSRLREANEDLRNSSRIMNSMIMRSVRERALLFGVIFAFIIVLCLSIYFSITRD